MQHHDISLSQVLAGSRQIFAPEVAHLVQNFLHQAGKPAESDSETQVGTNKLDLIRARYEILERTHAHQKPRNLPPVLKSRRLQSRQAKAHLWRVGVEELVHSRFLGARSTLPKTKAGHDG